MIKETFKEWLQDIAEHEGVPIENVRYGRIHKIDLDKTGPVLKYVTSPRGGVYTILGNPVRLKLEPYYGPLFYRAWVNLPQDLKVNV